MAGNSMLIDPISTTRPSIKDVAHGLNQVHRCFEEHKEHTLKNFKMVLDQSKAAALKAETASADIKDMKRALGLEEGSKPVAGLSSSWIAFRRTALATTTAITALFVAYKAFLVVLPSLIVLWHSIDAAARKGFL